MQPRVVLRWLALGAPYVWFGFATRFKAVSDFVGADFFKRFADRIHAEFEGQGTDAGLVASFDDLQSDRFDPSRVHPVIRDFYEHTSRYDLDISIKWNPMIRPFGYLYEVLVARQMQQLEIPLDNASLSGLDSWIELIQYPKGQNPEVRCWIRVDKDSRTPVYVGAYKTYQSRIDNCLLTYVSVAFPLPGGTMTTVLTPLNFAEDGLMLTTRHAQSTETGVYLVIPHDKSFTMTPAFGLSEEFHLQRLEEGIGIRVFHDCFWLGVRTFRLTYIITPAIRRNPEHLSALEKALQAKAKP